MFIFYVLSNLFMIYRYIMDALVFSKYSSFMKESDYNN